MSKKSWFWPILGLATILRVLRVLVRWDEVSWQYAAYSAPIREHLLSHDPSAMLSFTGLHPPLWYLGHAISEIVLPIPVLGLACSALFSLGAVYLFRDRPLVALLLATSPIQLAYAAELNNYPMTAMIVAGFIEPIVKELPMEYAVELNRLIELQMEGSVG